MTAITLPQYLIESSTCLVCFYLFYDMILKRETFFQFNRFYLLGTALFSLVIPLLSFEFSVAEAQSHFYAIALPAINKAQDSHQTMMTAVEGPTPFAISLGDLIRVIYYMGVFIMGLKFLDALVKVFNLIKSGHKKREGNEIIVKASSAVPASSFFSYIFWNAETESAETSQTIMNHELVHVRQWHSLDVIIMEIMVILNWFNPLIYLFRRSLRLTHEYIADRYVSSQMDKLTYANILLSHNFSDRVNALQHTFYSDVKQRLRMLGSGQSKQWQWLKLIGIVPIMMSLMTLFSFNFSEKIDFVTEGMELVNESFDEMESTTILELDELNEGGIAQRSAKSGSDFNGIDNNKFIFRWGNLLYYQPKSADDYPLDLSKNSFVYKLGQKPSMFMNNKYFRNFEFDLLLFDGEEQILTKRIYVNQDFDFERSYFYALDFDRVAIENFHIVDAEVEVNHQFSYSLGSGNISTPIFDPFNKSSLRIKGEQFALLPSKGIVSISGWPSWMSELSIDRVTEIVVDRNWELYKDEEKVEGFGGGNYDIQILVSREMVVDNTFEIADGSLPKNVQRKIEHDFSSTSRTITESFDLYNPKSAKHRQVIRKWFKTLSNDDVVYIVLENRNEIGESKSVSFVIKETELAYEPQDKLGKKYAGEIDSSNYQIVYRHNQKSLVRTDIHNPENQKIVKAFADTTQYEIIHTSNFSTEYRILDYNDSITSIDKTIVRSSPAIDDMDIHSLPEFNSEENNGQYFQWGRMLTMKETGNFSIKEFHRSRKSQPVIGSIDGEYKVVRFTIYVIEKDKTPKAFQSSSIKAYSLNNYFDGINNEVAIYFDDLIIEKEGEWSHIMDRYFFVFE